MAKYRKKPVVIEAMRFMGPFSFDEMLVEFEDFTGILLKSNEIQIETLEGKMIANLGDWIIKGVKGEFYPCKPDIFKQTYEPV